MTLICKCLRSFARGRRNVRFYSDGSAEIPKESLEDLLSNSTLGIGPYDEVDPEDNWRTSPYPKGTVLASPRSSHAAKSLRPSVDPRDTSIILFPGQGSQFVGMGRDLLKFPKARDIFDAANEAVKFDLLQLMIHGPKNKLYETVNSNLAVFVCSLAAIEKLKEERPTALENCMATAGFGVGELTALTFAGSIRFGDAMRLVRVRAEAMQLAAEMTPGGMATVIYGPESKLGKACIKAKEWARDRGLDNPQCKVATFLSPHVKIVAGHLEALKYLECNKKLYGIKEIKPLQAMGAFHTPLMLPAVPIFKKKIRNVAFSDPIISVHANVDGLMYERGDEIPGKLIKQLYRPIHWEQIMHILYERDPESNHPETVACGPGKELPEYLKWINAKAAEFCIKIMSLEFLESQAEKFKLRKVMRQFHMAGAFHTDLMKPAVPPFREALKRTCLSPSSIHVFSNLDAKRYSQRNMEEKLCRQMCRPILWEQLVQKMYVRPKEDALPSTYTPIVSMKKMLSSVHAKAATQCIVF